MKLISLISCLFITLTMSAQTLYQVSSSSEFNAAQDQASAGDTIAWLSGVYADTRMELKKDGLIITAQPNGTVLFTGASRAIIDASNVTFSGFQYVGGVIPSLNVIEVNGSDVLITQINIQNYTSRKYLIVDEESRRTTISYCNFENRLNLIDQNILSILVDNDPGYHKIQHCSFKNFDGIGNDQGIEPIRIGVSSQKLLESRTLVEYCYFTRCNGDGEIISHKARQNVYRYNTFEDNPVAELVLRHGDEGIVYGNFFLNNMGGIRVREGSHHFIYNNYFQGQDRRTIYLQNESSDPLSDIHIYHNTIIDSEEIRLGSSGSNPPSDVFIANNAFTDPKGQLFDEETGNETWVGNLFLGNLGIEKPLNGLVETDPMLSENSEGYFQPSAESPVIESASDDYPPIPLFEGMDYDHEIDLDLMRRERPSSVTNRAIGASEYSAEIRVQPHATEFNTGPSYLFENVVNYLAASASQLYISEEGESRSIYISSNLNWTVTSTADWITTDLSSGSNDSLVVITIDPNEETSNREGSVTISGESQTVTIDVFQDAGNSVGVSENTDEDLKVHPNPSDSVIRLENLPLSSFKALVEIIHLDGRRVSVVEAPIFDSILEVDIDSLETGIYILKAKISGLAGSNPFHLQRKFVKK